MYDFSYYLGILMTFSWGVQDAGLNCLVNSLLGFQFKQVTTPFSVYKFLQSLLIFVFTCVESATGDQQAYLIYFGVCYGLTLASWLVHSSCFQFLTKDQVTALRAATGETGQDYAKLDRQEAIADTTDTEQTAIKNTY